MSDEPNALAAFSPTTQSPAPATARPSPGLRPIAPNVALTTLDDESVRQYEFELYSGKGNVTDRICLLRPDAIAKGRTHYHDKLKGGVVCQSVFERSSDGKNEVLVEKRNCCHWLGDPQVRFAALVVKYHTKPNGELASPFGYDLKLWRFGADKFVQLRNINRDWPLDRHDLGILCTEEKYQKMTIGAKPDCLLLHPKFPPNVKTEIDTWATASLAKLARELGRTLSDQDLHKELMQAGILVGGNMPAPTMVQPGDAPVANFSDIISTAQVTQGPATPLPGTGQ